MAEKKRAEDLSLEELEEGFGEAELAEIYDEPPVVEADADKLIEGWLYLYREDFESFELDLQKPYIDFADFGDFATLLCKKGEEQKFELLRTSCFTAKTVLPESAVKNLFLRTRESGEKYVFGGMTRTLKKLLSGESEKAKTVRPVFCDSNGILWFPPFRIRDDIYNKREKTAYTLYYFEY